MKVFSQNDFKEDAVGELAASVGRREKNRGSPVKGGKNHLE